MESKTCPQCGSDRRDLRYLLAVPDDSQTARPIRRPGDLPTRGVECVHPWHDHRPHDCRIDGHDYEHAVTGADDLVAVLCTACGARWEASRVT